MPNERRSQFSILNSTFWRLVLLRLLATFARPLVRRTPDSITSVLYIKPDHLGDLLLATPVLAALRHRLPNARVTALVGPWSRMVLQRNPDIDVLLICPFPGFERRPVDDGRSTIDDGLANTVIHRRSSIVDSLSSLATPYRTLIHYALLLRAGHYDLAIIGRDDHWWGAALALLAGVPCRIGYAVPECRPFLTLALPWNSRDHVTAQGLALVESVARGSLSVVPDLQPLAVPAQLFAAATAGEQAAQPPPNPQPPTPNPQFSARFDPSQDDITWADSWIAAQGLADASLVLLHPGTGGPAKLWFAERWAAVADALQATGARLVLTGGPGELALVAEVAGHMRSAALALAGQTSVGQLAALMRRATLVLGVDSGPLHLAAAQSVRTLHLYGPGDAGRFGPWGDRARHVVLRADLWCSPCGEFAACPRGLAQPECMELIASSRVAERARAMLDTADR
jgi:ADP-heptose:LPS heptosyltransferase